MEVHVQMSTLTPFPEPGTGEWPYGYWDPEVGFGFGNPASHGLRFN